MSLGIAASDQSLPRAVKDCRVCNRRRIKCDRTLPKCKKCEIKKVECPGYALRIQWGQGVASRGKLTGKTIPVLEQQSISGKRSRNRSTSTSPSSSKLGQGNRILKPSGSPDSTGVVYPAAVPREDRSAAHLDRFSNEFVIDLNLSLCSLPSHLSNHSAQRLINYYDNVVTSTMLWIDRPENPWRTQILPLAMESPPLLLSILALSGEHSAARMGPTWAAENGIVSKNYRDKSLKLLAQELRTEIGEERSSNRRGPTNAMFATILLLCYFEMVQSDSALWQVHWQAARTIARRWTSSSHLPFHSDTTRRFLLKEAFVVDVFASSTTFDSDDEIPGSVLNEVDCNVFTDYMQLIQELTWAERNLKSGQSLNDFTLSVRNVQVLQDRFEYARMRTMRFGENIMFGSDQLREDFKRIVDIFHYVGIIYGCQCLLETVKRDSAPLKARCADSVLETLRDIRNVAAFCQDLVWPLFVVGTESRGNKKTQSFVESKLVEVMQLTGFSNCYQALLFLRKFWKLNYAVAHDWMQFARREAHSGTTFLVL